MISFIIPTKNEEKVIEKILQCLSEYKGEKEIIVSDGQSTDNTIMIAKQFADKVVEHEGSIRQTIALGRNDGARVARGDFLVFLDADVEIPDINAFFEKIGKIFHANSELAGLTVCIRVSKEQETFMDKIVFSSLNFYNLIMNNYFNAGASLGEFQMVRRNIFKQIGGYREDLIASEDFEFFSRVSKLGKTCLVNDLTVYHSGRRAHVIGWPKLLKEWFLNFFFVLMGKKSHSKEWEVIR